MATIKQIAEQSNVSMTTVSRVLNNDESLMVSAAVKNKIFDIAHQLGYVPPKKRRMQLEKGITIGVADWHIIRQEVQNIKFLDYVGIANRYCKQPISFKRMVYGERTPVDGIIALGRFEPEEIAYLKEQSYAILFINSDRQDYQYDRIIMDYNEGLVQMVDYLFHTKKCNSLGYIGGYYENGLLTIGKTRHNALVQILTKQEKYHADFFFIGELSKQSGATMAKEMLQLEVLPDAILLGNDQIAEGALEVFLAEDKKMLEEREIVIYKDIETVDTNLQTYTTIEMLPDFVWETAIKLMLERITGARTETMTVILPSKLCMK